MAKKSKEKSLVKVDAIIKNRVAKKVAGTPQTIGEFYDSAAHDKLQVLKRWQPAQPSEWNHPSIK